MCDRIHLILLALQRLKIAPRDKHRLFDHLYCSTPKLLRPSAAQCRLRG